MVRIKLSFWRFLCFERKKLLWRHGHMTLWELEKRCQTIWDTSDHAELQSAKETKNTQIVRWWDHMSCLNAMYVPKRLIFVTLFNNQPCIIKALFSYWMNVYVFRGLFFLCCWQSMNLRGLLFQVCEKGHYWWQFSRNHRVTGC